MALEKVISSRKLTRLRGGRLGKYIEGFYEWLQDAKFAISTIQRHLLFLLPLNDYLGDDPSHEGLSASDVDGFLMAYPSKCRSRASPEGHLRAVRYSIKRFTEYLVSEGLYDSQEEPQPVLDSYQKWMREKKNTAPSTLELRRQYLGRFLAWLGPRAEAECLSELTAEQVEEFFVSYARTMGKAARRSMQSTLRTFFRFCFHEGYIKQRLDLAVPTMRTYRLSTVPRGLSEAQAQKVLGTIDRSTNIGRRDFAILQLLFTFGVRGGQVCDLRLDDINWAEDQILFRALKRGKDSLLPLTAEVGESLLEYLRKARPTCCSDPKVFLTCRAPYRPFSASATVSEIVRRRILEADIDVPAKGAHAFRHGFASRMVQQGNSLKAVADVLGHRHLSTTFIYTKVDFDALRQVALDWPKEV